MAEATKLLSVTCDTFIETLEDCMKLSNANYLFEASQSDGAITPPNVNLPNKKVKFY